MGMARPRRHVSTYMLPRIFTGFKLIVKALRRLGFIWTDGLRPRTPGEGFMARLVCRSRARREDHSGVPACSAGCQRWRRTRYSSPRNLSFGSVTFFGLLASALA